MNQHLKLKPFDYQKEAIRFHLGKHYSLNGFEMGLGKSLIAIATALESGVDKVLIVCPAYLVPNWEAELEKCTTLPERFETVSYASLGKAISTFGEYKFVIFDEAHYLKNLKSLRTTRAHKLVKKHRPRYLLALTGTPIKNKVPEFYSLLRLCYYGNRYPRFEKYFKSFWLFCHKFCNKVIKNEGGYTRTSFEGLRNVSELKELVKPVYIRKRTKDVIDLPEMVDVDVVFNEKSDLDEHLKVTWEAYEGKKAAKTFASGKAVSALAKCKYTAKYVMENLEAMEKVVIFTDHIQAAKTLSEAIEGSCYVTGSTPSKDRVDYVDRINRGDIKVLVATIGSLSTGFNITGVNHMIINDYPWVPAELNQAKKRINRIGQLKTCFYYFMFVSSFDRTIWRTLKKKNKILEIMDED